MNPRPQRPERCALARLRYSPKAKNYRLIGRICPARILFVAVFRIFLRSGKYLEIQGSKRRGLGDLTTKNSSVSSCRLLTFILML